MKNKYVIIGGAALLLAVGVLSYLNFQKETTPATSEVTGEPAVTIVRTDSGYEPNEVTIQKGDIVLWKNESSEFHWPASDLHPTHGIYPEFDPLRPLDTGEDWKFQFDKVGTWKFHDHIRANKVGVIHVVDSE